MPPLSRPGFCLVLTAFLSSFLSSFLSFFLSFVCFLFAARETKEGKGGKGEGGGGEREGHGTVFCNVFTGSHIVVEPVPLFGVP